MKSVRSGRKHCAKCDQQISIIDMFTDFHCVRVFNKAPSNGNSITQQECLVQKCNRSDEAQDRKNTDA